MPTIDRHARRVNVLNGLTLHRRAVLYGQESRLTALTGYLYDTVLLGEHACMQISKYTDGLLKD